MYIQEDALDTIRLQQLVNKSPLKCYYQHSKAWVRRFSVLQSLPDTNLLMKFRRMANNERYCLYGKITAHCENKTWYVTVTEPTGLKHVLQDKYIRITWVVQLKRERVPAFDFLCSRFPYLWIDQDRRRSRFVQGAVVGNRGLSLTESFYNYWLDKPSLLKRVLTRWYGDEAQPRISLIENMLGAERICALLHPNVFRFASAFILHAKASGNRTVGDLVYAFVSASHNTNESNHESAQDERTPHATVYDLYDLESLKGEKGKRQLMSLDRIQTAAQAVLSGRTIDAETANALLRLLVPLVVQFGLLQGRDRIEIEPTKVRAPSAQTLR